MTQKQSLADLIRCAGPVMPEIRKAASDSHQKIKDDWERTKATPEYRAMEKLEAALRMLKNDPEISVSEPCTDVLELVIELLDRAWHHHDLQTIISPMQKHFDGVKAKEANEKLKEKREKERNLHYDFLDEQKDITNTVLLATRLRKKILIDSIRGSEDTVRDWKKLRSPSKT